MALFIDPITNDITIGRGDVQKVDFTIKNQAGVLQDVSASSFILTVKKNLEDTQAQAKFSLASPVANGIDLVNAVSGVVTAKFLAAHTQNLAGPYYCDVEMTTAGEPTTIYPAANQKGRFYVRKDVTTSGSAPLVSPALQYLTYICWSFGHILQVNEFFWKNFNIARSGISATIIHAHLRSDRGPNGGTGVIALQDDPTTPVQVVNLNVTNTVGAETDQEFDTLGFGGATLITPLTLLNSTGKKLSVKVTTPQGIEGPGTLALGILYA